MARQSAERRAKKTKVFTRVMHLKCIVVFAVVLMLILFLLGRIIFLYVTKGEEYSNAVLSHLSYSGSVVPYERGTITDRNGMELASSEAIYNLILDPALIYNEGKDEFVQPTIQALVQAFGLNYDDIYTRIMDNRAKAYYVVKECKGLGYDKVTAFNALAKENPKIKGVWFELEYKRVYPYESMASHVIGYTNAGNVGSYGIEQYYNDYLNGTDGRTYGYYDNELNLVETKVPAVDGATVVSTIDTFCQTVVEDEIAKLKQQYSVKNIGVILANPNTGEIYAMASNSGYDLNNPRDLSMQLTAEELETMDDTAKSKALNDMWRNFTVCDTYEPGSTYKLITVSGALEENAIQVSDNADYFCGGAMQVGIWRIRCSNRNGHGQLTLTQAIEKSCNVALMQIGEKMGRDSFIKYQKLFNYGQKTGIDLPGEASGILLPEDSMGEAELATSTFGQSFNVTMIQMVAAYSSLINGGYYYRPHVVSRVVDANGINVYMAGDTLMKLTVSKETSAYMRMATESVVENGTASAAHVDGYRVGGKTGTAQKGKREDNLFVISFIGSVPADDPELVSYVVIDQIDDPTYYNTSKLATQMTSDILARVLPHMGIYPEDGDIDYHVGEFDEINEGLDVSQGGEGDEDGGGEDGNGDDNGDGEDGNE